MKSAAAHGLPLYTRNPGNLTDLGGLVRMVGVSSTHSLTPSWLAAIFIAMWAPAEIGE